jgi:hypothetical protein
MSEPHSAAEGAGFRPEGRPRDTFEPTKHKINARWASLWLSPVLLVIAAAASYAGVRAAQTHTYTDLGPAAFIAAAFFLVSGVTAPVAILREGRIEEEEDKRCNRECDELDEALDKISDRVLRGLAKSNFKQMKIFTVIALRQARMSYYMSIVAASVALLVLVSGGTVTVVLPGTSAKVAAASLTALGATLGGFVSTTFLKTYWMASRQMSYYYGQPLVHCYLLHAEWLALMLDEHPHRKEDINLWQRILEASIQAGENAQTHLLNMQEQGFNQSIWIPDGLGKFGTIAGEGVTGDNHDR